MTKRALFGFKRKQVDEFMEHLKTSHEAEKLALEQEIIGISYEIQTLTQEIASFQNVTDIPWETDIAQTLAIAHIKQTELVNEALQQLKQAEEKNDGLFYVQRDQQESIRNELLEKLNQLNAFNG
jgi:hypothetical protein